MDRPREMTRWILRLCGAAVLLFSGVPGLWLISSQTGAASWRFMGWLAALLGFGLAFWIASGRALLRAGRREMLLLLIQLTAVAVMLSNACTGLEWTLLAVIAAEVALLLPLVLASMWVLAQTVLLILILLTHYPLETALFFAGIVFIFTVLIVLVSHLARSQIHARNALAQANGELRATQALLADSIRMAERSRISREMHDLLGHHLTALSLNLEVAIQKGADGDGREFVERAQGITKSLLQDVREVVSELRTAEVLDVVPALRALVQDIPAPAIHLSVPDGLILEDPTRAHVILRVAQEIVTNAIRHSGASNLWIELLRQNGALVLEARDDGRGATTFSGGHGLQIMRERVDSLGGTLEVQSGPRPGVTVRATFPEATGT